MSNRFLKACIWLGLVGGFANGAGLFGLAGFFPLLDPAASAEEIAAIYRANPIGIALGSLTFLVAAMCFLCFAVALTMAMKRMRGELDALTLTQVLSGAIASAIFILPTFMFSLAAFRAERSAELVLLLNDLGWFTFIVPALPGTFQIGALGFGILSDRNRENPVMPRWVGYFCLWIATLLLPSMLAAIFKTGPFAWNGILGFWIPGGAVVTWIIVIIVQMLKAVRSPQWAVQVP